LTTESKNGCADHGTAEKRHSKKNSLCNGRTDRHPENWRKRKRYACGKRDDGVGPASQSRNMFGSHHQESHLGHGPLRGKLKKRRFVFANGGARDRSAGKSRTKKTLFSVARSEIGNVAGIVPRVTKY
jgi:hypothetical protein